MNAKISTLFFLVLLLATPFFSVLTSFSNAQVQQSIGKGNINFRPNQLPWISLSYSNGVFKIGNEVTVSSSLIIASKSVQLKDISSSLSKTTTSRTTIICEKNNAQAHFGYTIVGLSKAEAESFDSLDFKIVTIHKIVPNSFIDERVGKNITRYGIPDLNLEISFEDLQKTYTSTVDSTGIKILNLKGLTNIIADPIVYSSNIIIVTGYTSGSPCGFNDLWLADKKGIFDLTSRTGISAIDANPVALTTNARPTDFYTLGSNGNQLGNLSVTVSSFSLLTSCSITIMGTDRLGNAQSETMVFTGNGQTYSAYYYHTLTTSQVTAFVGIGSFSYKVTQGQWGIVWKQSSTQYNFGCKIKIGDGSIATYFTDTKKQVTFIDGIVGEWEYIIDITQLATFTLGTLVDAVYKTSKNGCDLLCLDTDSYVFLIFAEGYNGIYNLYGCHLQAHGGIKFILDNAGLAASQIYNCILQNCQIRNNNPTIFNVQLTQCLTESALFGLNGLINYVRITDCDGAIFHFSTLNGIYRNIYSRNMASQLFLSQNAVGDDYVIDADVDAWSFNWWGTNTNKVYRQYIFDCVASFQNITVMQNANVTLTYAGMGGGTIGSWLTNSTGQIPTQTLTMGYYNQTNGDTLQSYNPYTLTITKTGFQNYIKIFIMNQQYNWRISLASLAKVNPVARFNNTISQVSINQIVSFDGSGSLDPDGGSLTNYLWNFGDGSTLSGNYPVASHFWAANGIYTVKLTVTDDEAATNSFQWHIVVSSTGPEISAAVIAGVITIVIVLIGMMVILSRRR